MADSSSVLAVTTIAKIPELIPWKWSTGKSMALTSEHLITVCDQGDLWSNPSLSFINMAGSQPHVTRTDFKRHRVQDRIVNAARSPNGEFCLVQDAAKLLRVLSLEDEMFTVASVDFAAWIDDTCFAVLTEKDINHMDTRTWKVGWMCSRTEVTARSYTVTDYQMSRSRQWSFLAAVKLDVDQATGLVEVWHTEAKFCRTIAGFAAVFVPPLSTNNRDAILVADTAITNNMHRVLIKYRPLAYSQLSVDAGATKTFTLEIDYSEGGNGLTRDVPIAITPHPMDDLPLAFVTTKMGYVHLVDYRNMCHLGSKKLTDEQNTLCAARSACSFGGSVILTSEGTIFGVNVSFDHLITTLLNNNLSMEAGKYAIRLNVPMENETFMRVVPAVGGMTLDFATFCGFLRLNAVHLSADQAVQVFKWAVDVAPSIPHHFMLLGHLAMELCDKIGLDSLIPLFEHGASNECLFVFLKSLSTKNMPEIPLLKLVKVAFKHGIIQILELHFIANQSKLHPDAVLDCLLSEIVEPGVQSVVDEFVEKFCIKYCLIVKLVTYKISNGRPVRLDAILEKLPKKESKKQLCLVIDVLLNTVDANLASLEVKHDLRLTVDMLQAAYPDVLRSLDEDAKWAAKIGFLEYLTGKGIPDETIHSQLVKLYIETMEEGEDLDRILRSNKLYDAAAVGQWCEQNRWLTKALMVYEQRQLSDDFIRISDYLEEFRRQFDYLLKLRSKVLWERVLTPFNERRWHLVNIMMDRFEDGYKASADDFEQLAVLIEALSETDLISEAQAFIHKLLIEAVSTEHIRFLQQHAVRCLLKSGYPAEEFRQRFDESLDTYDPCTVAEVLVQGGMLRLAKDILVKGKCWKEAAQLVVAHKDEDLGDIKELAFQSRDPDLMSTVGESYLASGKLAPALQYLVEAGRFTKYKLVCSMVPLDNNFDEWELLIRFLEGALTITKDPSLSVTLALAYGKTNRMHDLQKLMTSEGGSRGAQDVNCCRICEDHPKDVTFAPCGHMVACMGCAQELSVCPICRRPIDLKIKTFSS
ncbi:clathrin heavy chain 1-like isoform X2 [Paramacrobiotus metropolitanus]|uniref:clathrin heavy chain 1-like isoform X2 n=1 Tax=Paramacrobiotus metropolitanus TaxID=2943436 RepID=UPI002445A135|nr:clathrin heavy chain 1-like isoform X2 [Paramacrobiotus metropolitanus]